MGQRTLSPPGRIHWPMSDPIMYALLSPPYKSAPHRSLRDTPSRIEAAGDRAGGHFSHWETKVEILAGLRMALSILEAKGFLQDFVQDSNRCDTGSIYRWFYICTRRTCVIRRSCAPTRRLHIYVQPGEASQAWLVPQFFGTRVIVHRLKMESLQ
jgi:hypothetical protein